MGVTKSDDVTELESKHITAMIRRHVAISFCKPEVVTMKIAFDIDMSVDDVNIHPAVRCSACTVSS